MPSFQSYDTSYGPADLAAFQSAYEEACRKLGVDASHDPRSDLCNSLAIAIMAAARMGERDPVVLRAFAVTFGLRNCKRAER